MRNTRMRRATTWGLLGAFLGTLPGAPAAIAAPEGERVVKGEARFERNGSHTRITTKTRETIVDYDRFGIAEGESVRIDQPSKRSRILNRVPRGGEESRIDGALSSNGVVYILNPAGVFIGDRAVLDVNELVAGAAALSNKDFLRGVDRFTDVTGDVGIAAGARIHAARDVVLVGRHVENLGSISSERGMVAMVAGEGVLLTRHGGHVLVRVDGEGEAPAANDFALTQGGTIEGKHVTLAAGDAYSLAMNHTGITRAGEIHVQAEGDGLVQVAGALDASRTAPGEQGGRIEVQGSRIVVQDAVLDASGTAGGGDIRIGGDLRGGGEMPTARRVYVGEDAALRADATASGDGGTVIVYADEQTSFYGSLSARGGPQGGDGGFAEISGRSLAADGDVDLGAPQGRTGTLLYDPAKIVIVGGTADGSDDPDDSADEVAESRLGQVLSGDTGTLVDDEFQIHESEIEGTNANIVLEATNRIEVTGTFDHDSSTHEESDESGYEGAGVVVILPGNSLTLRTTGATAPDDATDLDLGIDLTTSAHGNALTWRVSEGGNITLATNLDSIDIDPDEPPPVLPPKASILVGRLESTSARFQGSPNFDDVEFPVDRRIEISAGRGDVVVHGIDGDGQDALPPQDDGDDDTVDKGRSASAGATIRIASEQGHITIAGPIEARGGSGTGTGTGQQGSPGADGAEIRITAEAGNLTVDGPIDASGGDGRGAIFLRNPGDPDNPLPITGGGAGGAVFLAANGGNDGEGNLVVTDDIVVKGGRGLPHMADEDDDGEDEAQATPGGIGGGISLSGQQTVTVGTPEPDGDVLLDASGGDGSAEGGTARNGVELEAPGLELLSSFRIAGRIDGQVIESTTGEVEIHGELRARGGDARRFHEDDGDPENLDIPQSELFGGVGGNGGNLVAQANSLAGDDMRIDLSGGRGNRQSAGPTDPPRDPNGNALPLGGAGGDVAILGQKQVNLGGTGGNGIVSLGGDAVNGIGGSGGSVNISTGDLSDASDEDPDDVLIVGDIDVSGGNANPENSATQVTLPGGIGGTVTLTATEKTTGRLLLRGRVGGDGGTGEDGESDDPVHAEGAVVTVSAQDAIQVHEDALNDDGTVPEGVVLSGSIVSIGALNIGTRENEADGLAPIPIAGTARSGDEGSDVGIATASETLAVEIRNDNGLDAGAGPDALEEMSVEMRSVTGDASVRRGAEEVLHAAAVDGLHTLDAMRTNDDDPMLSYRFNVEVEADQPQPALAIAHGAVELGANGGNIRNSGLPAANEPSGLADNRGDVVGTGDGDTPHVQSSGTVRVQGRNLGNDTTPLVFAGDGTDAILLLDAQGEIDARVPDGATPFRGIEIAQFDAAAATDVDLRNADGIQIVGTGEEDAPVSRIVRAVTTDSGTGLTYRLETIPSEDGVDEADIQVDEVDLGGDGILRTRGDIVLRDDVVGVTPVQTNGHALFLWSVAGSVRQESTSAPSIDMTGPGSDRELLLVVDEDAGSSTAPLRTVGVEKLAGQAATGDIVLVNEDPESTGLHITKLTPRDPSLLETPPNATTHFGLFAGNQSEPGSIDVTNQNEAGDARIVLAELGDAQEFAIAHLRAEDDVRLHADAIEIENARFFETIQPVVGPIFLAMNDARIVAGEDVVLAGNEGTPFQGVRTSLESSAEHPQGGADTFIHSKLRIEAGGTTEFHGDVGGDGSDDRHQLALLDTTAASTEGTSADTRVFRVGQARFRGALDGPAGVQVFAQDLSPSQPHLASVTFEGDLGAQQRLAGVDVQAEEIHFTSADRISATGDVTLDANPDDVPAPIATIFDTQGGLQIDTQGAFTTGPNDKLSVQGPLGIRADSVEVGDVNATRELSIDAPEIRIRARAPGQLLLKNGDEIEDGGTDLVADRVRLSSVPTVPNPEEGTVRIGVGGGGIRAPGGVFDSFPVVFFTEDVEHVTAGDMQGPDGLVLDLQATGRPIVGDPAEDLPRERPLPHPSLPPRYTEEGPAPAPAVDSQQLLAYLRCGDAGGPAADCDTGDAQQLGAVRDWQDSALATPRAEEIARSYREMRSRDLGAVFDAAGAGFREAQGFGEFDADAFARYLERSGEHPEARAAIHRLANVLVEIDLLGLPAEEETRVRRELAGELAAEADLPGFDTDAVLLAVEATPIELPN